MKRSGFGIVYKALDKRSGMYVAIKKTTLIAEEETAQPESKLFMKCNTPFIVRCNGVVRSKNELWVMLDSNGLRIRLRWSSVTVDHSVNSFVRGTV